MFKTILVTLDGSDLAERALKPAFDIAEKFGSQVVLLRVPIGQQFVTMPSGTGVLVPDEILEQDREEAGAYLRAIKAQWQVTLPNIRIEASPGSPPEIILGVARAQQVDLIVMSTHGRSGISRLLYGSVAESVLRGAHTPILLIPVKL